MRGETPSPVVFCNKPGKVAAKRVAAKAAKPTGTAGTGERSTSTTSRAPRVGAKPTLLAGGDPQIAKANGDAPVQAYIAVMPGWKRDVGRRLDALIGRIVPDVRKAVRRNSPFYGVEGQAWFISFHRFTKYVRVAFFRGASLRPVPPGESKMTDVRYLEIHEHDRLDEKLVASWMRQASELPARVPQVAAPHKVPMCRPWHRTTGLGAKQQTEDHRKNPGRSVRGI